MFQVSTDKKGNGIQVRISSVAFDPSSWIPNWRENNKSPCWLEIKSTFYYKNKIIAHDLQITIVLIIFFSHKSHPLYRILQDRLRLYATQPHPHHPQHTTRQPSPRFQLTLQSPCSNPREVTDKSKQQGTQLAGFHEYNPAICVRNQERYSSMPMVNNQSAHFKREKHSKAHLLEHEVRFQLK